MGLVVGYDDSDTSAASEVPQSTIDTKRWWKHKNLLTLNLLLLLPLMSMYTLG